MFSNGLEEWFPPRTANIEFDGLLLCLQRTVFMIYRIHGFWPSLEWSCCKAICHLSQWSLMSSLSAISLFSANSLRPRQPYLSMTIWRVTRKPEFPHPTLLEDAGCKRCNQLRPKFSKRTKESSRRPISLLSIHWSSLHLGQSWVGTRNNSKTLLSASAIAQLAVGKKWDVDMRHGEGP